MQQDMCVVYHKNLSLLKFLKRCVLLKVQGKERELVAKIGHQLGLDGTYIPRSYIEQVWNSCIFPRLIILIHKYCLLMSPSEA